MAERKETNIDVWMIQYMKVGLMHTDFIIGSLTQAIIYGEKEASAYNAVMLDPVKSKIPKILDRTEKIVDLSKECNLE